MSAGLYLLVVLLPFELPRPIFTLGGFEITNLELVAAGVLALAAVELLPQQRWRELASLPLLPLAILFLAVCVLSSFTAAPPKLLPLKFTLRVAAGVTFLALAALVMRRRGVRGFAIALTVSGSLVALLGLGEAFDLQFVNRMLSAFRAQEFEVGGVARVASTFSYPNTAAGFLVLTLGGALMLALDPTAGKAGRWISSTASLLMFLVVLLTYSRGALLGALTVSVCLYLWFRSHEHAMSGVRSSRRLAAALLGVFLFASVLNAVVDPYVRLRAFTEGDASWYRAEFEPAISELQLAPSELVRVPLKVRNAGRMSWNDSGDKTFHLSYHWYDLTARGVYPLEGERSDLGRAVSPGESVRLEAYVRAPEVAGTYLLVWDMVQENTTWFVGKGGGRKALHVHVSGQPTEWVSDPGTRTLGPSGSIAEGDVMLTDVAEWLVTDSWFPGRLELWHLAIRLFAQRPLLGVGPDNYRWLYGPAAGHARWDERVFSNSLYLETLATTGLFGAASFLALLIGALRGGLRLALRDGRQSDSLVISSWPAMALVASLLGFLVHGVFDYLLEGTSIYLAFYILLGSLSALMARQNDLERAARRRERESFEPHACWI